MVERKKRNCVKRNERARETSDCCLKILKDRGGGWDTRNRLVDTDSAYQAVLLNHGESEWTHALPPQASARSYLYDAAKELRAIKNQLEPAIDPATNAAVVATRERWWSRTSWAC